MKKTSRQWLNYFVLFFWFLFSLRVGGFLYALWLSRTGAHYAWMPGTEGIHLSALQRSFFLHGIAVDAGIAVSLTGMWLVSLVWERARRSPAEA